MKKCDCYHIETKRLYTYSPITGDPIGHNVDVGVCWGTKECDECSCGGDECKCDFYPEVRKKALKEVEPKFGEWISVKDKLPIENPCDEYYDTVIIALKSGKVVCGCYRNHDKEWWGDITDGEYSNITDFVTHWMPLPTSPKGD